MSAQALVEAALAKGLHLTFAESCTGGLLSATVTDIAGASGMFQRGFVTYSNDAKHELLGVTHSSLNDFGAVSEQVAAEMAQGARKAAKADIALSITGIAGPGGSDHKPEGRVCFGICSKNQPLHTETVEFGAQGRSQVRAAATAHGLTMLLRAISVF